MRSGIMGQNVQGDLGPFTMYTSVRGKVVAYLRAPPLTPATPLQKIYRDQFTAIAKSWQAETAETRRAWQTAVDRAHLKLTGYNLYTWYNQRGDIATIRTIERQSGVTLL